MTGQRACRWHDALQFPAMLLALKAAQYTVVHLNETKLHGEPLDWRADLAPLGEVTAGNLALDLADALALGARMLGCPLPQPLAGKFSGWGVCNQIPEQVGRGTWLGAG
jgi:hypothetical protein